MATYLRWQRFAAKQQTQVAGCSVVKVRKLEHSTNVALHNFVVIKYQPCTCCDVHPISYATQAVFPHTDLTRFLLARRSYSTGSAGTRNVRVAFQMSGRFRRLATRCEYTRVNLSNGSIPKLCVRFVLNPCAQHGCRSGCIADCAEHA